MRVLLKREIPGIGHPGDIVDVRDAYARNYLLPQQAAIPATAGAQAAQAAKTAKQKLGRDRQQAMITALVKRLAGVNLRFSAKASPPGKLFAAIKADVIAHELHRQYDVDTKDLRCQPDHLKTIGEHQVKISIGDQHFTCLVTITHAEA